MFVPPRCSPRVGPLNRTIRPLVILALSCAAARGDEAENYRHLQAMPRERRAALAQNLEQFDRLDASERAALRKLDRDLARRDPIDQARYRSLMRRYHLWTNGLSEEQRRALQAAPTPEARLAQARLIRQKAGVPQAAGPKLSGVRAGEFGLIGPYEMAFILQVWNKLPNEKKQSISALRGGKLFAAIRAEAGHLGVAHQRLPADVDRVYQARLEADPALKSLLGTSTRKPEPAKKDETSARVPEKNAKQVDHPYAEFLYFEDPEHRPKPVPLNHFARFEASCPPWLQAMTDPLVPDDARAYLTAVYRLLYPYPSEMPEKVPGPSAPGPATPKPAPKSPTGPASPL
jgi:hypothetical protein